MAQKKLVVLTGAGMSAESGLKTFRGSDGLWEGYSIYDVATPEAWAKDPGLVQQFYNERRKQVRSALPNKAHELLARLEKQFDVYIITQNIDDLHERAGSTNVLHLHGVITKGQSVKDSRLTYALNSDEITANDLCVHGLQLRPHVVWFGEAVPMIGPAATLCQEADIFMVIGTSLAVYPAAGLIDHVPAHVFKYIIDPETPPVSRYENVISVAEKAHPGLQNVLKDLL